MFSEKANQIIASATKDKPHIKFTVGVYRGGETVLKQYDATGEIPYESHLYEIGSVGKVFTTSLLAKYLHEGKMNLNDSVAKYLPELDDGRYHPTLLRLATHTAGYPTRYPLSKQELFHVARKQIAAQLTKKPAKIDHLLRMNRDKMITLAKESNLRDKDYGWTYSNYGISLLGHAIAAVAGQDFWDLMNDFLAHDLGLSNSFMGTDSRNLLKGYSWSNEPLENWRGGREDYLAPAGSITSCAEDLLAFAKRHIENDPAYLALTHVRYDMKSKHSDMGLGWWIDYKNPNMLYHSGMTEGFCATLAFDRQKKAAVVLLANVIYYKGQDKLFAEILNHL